MRLRAKLFAVVLACLSGFLMADELRDFELEDEVYYENRNSLFKALIVGLYEENVYDIQGEYIDKLLFRVSPEHFFSKKDYSETNLKHGQRVAHPTNKKRRGCVYGFRIHRDETVDVLVFYTHIREFKNYKDSRYATNCDPYEKRHLFQYQRRAQIFSLEDAEKLERLKLLEKYSYF